MPVSTLEKTMFTKPSMFPTDVLSFNENKNTNVCLGKPLPQAVLLRALACVTDGLKFPGFFVGIFIH